MDQLKKSNHAPVLHSTMQHFVVIACASDDRIHWPVQATPDLNGSNKLHQWMQNTYVVKDQ